MARTAMIPRTPSEIDHHGQPFGGCSTSAGRAATYCRVVGVRARAELAGRGDWPHPYALVYGVFHNDYVLLGGWPSCGEGLLMPGTFAIAFAVGTITGLLAGQLPPPPQMVSNSISVNAGQNWYLGESMTKATTNSGAWNLDFKHTLLRQGTWPVVKGSLAHVEEFRSLHHLDLDLTPRSDEAEVVHSHPKHHVDVSQPATSPSDVQGHVSQTAINLNGAEYEKWDDEGRPMPDPTNSNTCPPSTSVPEVCTDELYSSATIQLPGTYEIRYWLGPEIGVKRYQFFINDQETCGPQGWCWDEPCQDSNDCYTIRPVRKQSEWGSYDLILV